MSDAASNEKKSGVVKKKPVAVFLDYITRWEGFLIIVLVLVVVVNSLTSPYFLNAFNLMNTTFNFMEKAIVAMPLMLVIVAGEIDISVAGIMAMSATLMGLAAQLGATLPMVLLVGLVSGLLAGMLNGFIITRFGVPSIAVSIGAMSLYRGISYVILGDRAFTEYPEGFGYIGQGFIGETIIPFPLVLFAVLAVVFGLILHRTTFGRRLYAIGNNPVAAQFSGIPVNKYKRILFMLSGTFSGLAACVLTSRISTARPNMAYGWELEIVTLVVLGGVSIYGGRGSVFGVITSIFIIGLVRFGMALVNVPGQVMNIVTGFLLIAAILLPGLLGNLRRRLLERAGLRRAVTGAVPAGPPSA
jgi:rhamnose transport system permease protein